MDMPVAIMGVPNAVKRRLAQSEPAMDAPAITGVPNAVKRRLSQGEDLGTDTFYMPNYTDTFHEEKQNAAEVDAMLTLAGMTEMGGHGWL